LNTQPSEDHTSHDSHWRHSSAQLHVSTVMTRLAILNANLHQNRVTSVESGISHITAVYATGDEKIWQSVLVAATN